MASRAAPAAAMSLAACSSCSSITSLPASSGSVVSFPRYRSGATATNPWAARRSATSRMWGTRPLHSWMTTAPGPLREGGREIYAGTASPLTGISVIEPAMSWPSWIVLAPGDGLILAPRPRLDHSGRSIDARQGPTRSRAACRGRAPGGGEPVDEHDGLVGGAGRRQGVGSPPQGGVPPGMRVDGQLIVLDGPSLTPEAAEGLLREVIRPDLYDQFQQTNEADFAYSRPGGGGF